VIGGSQLGFPAVDQLIFRHLNLLNYLLSLGFGPTVAVRQQNFKTAAPARPRLFMWIDHDDDRWLRSRARAVGVAAAGIRASAAETGSVAPGNYQPASQHKVVIQYFYEPGWVLTLTARCFELRFPA